MQERDRSADPSGLRPEEPAGDEQAKPVATQPRTQVKGLRDIEFAAARYSCTPRLIRKLIAERRVPVVRIGRLIRFRDEDLDAFEEASRQAAVRGPLVEQAS
ncbi:MAG: excisionase family DNA-binding protein [Acidimicrobiales bacterium]